MLRAVKRTITGALAFGIAVVVAMVTGRCVAALQWVVRWPDDGDGWWVAVVVLGTVVSLATLHRSRVRGETTAVVARSFEDPPLPLRQAPALVAATATGVGTGVPLGLDGPALYLGGAMGAWSARTLRRDQRAWSLAAGVAGLGMALAAPVAGALFVGELGAASRRSGRPRRRDLVPIALGGLAAWVVRRASGQPGGVVGRAPDLSAQSVVLGALVIGVVCGVLGGPIRNGLAAAMRARWTRGRRSVVGVVTVGVALSMAWAITGNAIYLGSGARLVEWARSAEPLPVAVAAAGFALVVGLLVAADVVGGVLLPLLAIGGAVGVVLTRTWLPGTSISFAIVAGGCALVAAAHRAPATAMAFGVALLGWSAGGGGAALAAAVAAAAAGLPNRPHVRS